MTAPAIAFELTHAPLRELAADWLVVGVWEDAPVSERALEADAALGGLVARLATAGDLTGKKFEQVPVYSPAGFAASRLLFVGLGRREHANRLAFHEVAGAATRFLTAKKLETLAVALPDAPAGVTAEAVALGLGVGIAAGSYGPGIRKAQPPRFAPAKVLFAAPAGFPADAVTRAATEARAVNFARELVNTPPSELYPETFAAAAVDAGRAAGFAVEIWDEARLIAERMGSLLAVARGSDRPPRLAVLRYAGNPGGPTLGLVGKGVTFDSGGLSLKTSEQMVDMKCDMAGAAAVLAGVRAAAELKLPVNLLGVLALVENMPSGKAVKLGDVLTARNGKTIEVLNTDAEGRLILADALSFAAEQGVGHLVDFATLTGACMIALGTEVAGLMTNDDPWGDRVLAAVAAAGERAWKLPMDAFYDDLIKSKVADMRNTSGGRYAGAIGAAKLLQQFVGSVPWAHLDIAGPAWAEGELPHRDAGGTGTMVRAIVELSRGYR